MEPNQNNQNNSGNTSNQTGPPPNFNGFDLNGLLNNATFLEWVKPLLSGLGAVGTTYFMWIKPLQEKVDAMNIKLPEQEKQISRLEHDVKELKNESDTTKMKLQEQEKQITGLKHEIEELKKGLDKPVFKPKETQENQEVPKTEQGQYFDIRKERSPRLGGFRKRRNLDL